MIFEFLGFGIMIVVAVAMIGSGWFIAGFIYAANNNRYTKDVGIFIIMVILGIALLGYCAMFSPISISFN